MSSMNSANRKIFWISLYIFMFEWGIEVEVKMHGLMVDPSVGVNPV